MIQCETAKYVKIKIKIAKNCEKKMFKNLEVFYMYYTSQISLKLESTMFDKHRIIREVQKVKSS